MLESRPDSRVCSAEANAFASASADCAEVCDETPSIQSALAVELEEAADCSQFPVEVSAFSQLEAALEIPDIVLSQKPLFKDRLWRLTNYSRRISYLTKETGASWAWLLKSSFETDDDVFLFLNVSKR